MFGEIKSSTMSKTITPNTDAPLTFQLVLAEKDAISIWKSMGEAILKHTFDTASTFSSENASSIGPDTLILSGNAEMLVDGQKVESPKGGWPVRTTFFPLSGSIGCMIDDQPAILNAHPDIPNITEWLQFVHERNKAAGYALPNALKKEIAKESPKLDRTNALPQVFCFTNDNINRAVVTSFARASEWQDGEHYFKGLEQEYKNLKISVSLPNGDKAVSLWDFLQRGGAAMVKAHYALWARYYEQVPDGLSLEYVVVNINDFCRDLGYAKATNGGYKPETKRRAAQLLEALTTAEIAATYQVPGQKKGQTKTRKLRGAIWQRGLAAEEQDTYEDLLGSVRAGDPSQWIPCGFSFAPGPWHADKEWRRYNRYVGKVGAGLMQLRCDKDEWAILIGGYLGTLARTGQYRNRRLKVATILENTGLGRADKHRKSEHREKFYRALERLVEENVIAASRTDGFDDSDVDPDDLHALAEYGTSDPFPVGDWRSHVVEFTFDFEGDMHRLQTRTKAVISPKRDNTTQKTPTHAT
jgi:hypothetical protein